MTTPAGSSSGQAQPGRPRGQCGKNPPIRAWAPWWLSMNRIAVKGDAGSLLEALPWLVVLILLAVASGSTFLLPMEMRGSALGG